MLMSVGPPAAGEFELTQTSPDEIDAAAGDFLAVGIALDCTADPSGNLLVAAASDGDFGVGASILARIAPVDDGACSAFICRCGARTGLSA